MAERHGLTGSPEYISWAAMRQRCLNPKATSYARYGGRGITICARWEMFSNFLADLGPRPSPQHSLERRDVDGPYEPGNCVWATKRQQQNNRRGCRRVEWRGEVKTVAEWAAVLSIPASTIQTRLNKGWSPEQVFSQAGHDGHAHERVPAGEGAE